MIGVFLDDGADAPVIRKLGTIIAQVQGNGGAPLGLFHGLHAEIGFALGLPVHPFRWIQSGAPCQHFHPVGNDKGGVKSHTELADQLGVLLLVTGQLIEKLGGAGLGDRAQLCDHVLTGHADTVVGDGQGLGFRVESNGDSQVGITFVEGVVVQGLETQLVRRIRGVGNQLTEKDFPVAIQ